MFHLAEVVESGRSVDRCAFRQRLDAKNFVGRRLEANPIKPATPKTRVITG